MHKGYEGKEESGKMEREAERGRGKHMPERHRMKDRDTQGHRYTKRKRHTQQHTQK